MELVHAREEAGIADLLIEAGSAIVEWTDLSTGLQRLVDILLQAVPHTRAVICRFDDRGESMQVLAAGGDPSPEVGTTLPIPALRPSVRKIVGGGKTAVVDFDALSPEVRGLGDRYDAHLLLAVPVTFANRTLGAILLDDPETARRPFSEREVEIVEAFAAQSASAIETARLFEEQTLRTHRSEALNEMMGLVTSSLDPAEVAEVTLDYIVRRLGVDMVTLWRFDPEVNRLFPMSDVGIGAELHAMSADGVAVDDPNVVSIAFMARRPLDFDKAHLDDTPESARLSSELLGPSLESLLVLPVPGRDSMRGVITLAWSSPQGLDDDAIAFFSSAVSAFAIAAENAELFEEVRQRGERIAALHRVTEIAVSSLDAAETSQRALQYLADELGFDASALWIVEDGSLRVLASVNFLDAKSGQAPLAAIDSPCGAAQVVRTGEPVTASDPSEMSSAVKEMLASMGLECEAYAIVPMQAQGRTFGALHFSWLEARKISSADVEFYMSIANEIGIALENARLYAAQVEAQQETNRELATTALLLKAAGAFAELSELDAVFDAFAEIMLAASDHTRVTVYLWNDAAQELSVKSAVGDNPLPVALVAQLDEFAPTTQSALAYRRTRVVDIAEEPVGQHSLADTHGISLQLALPLARGDNLIGLVGIDDVGSRREFTAREIAVFEAIVAQAAIAIENVRLFEGEHRVAETLQAALLEVPKNVEGIEHAEAYRSATETAQVGGDFYDIFEIAQGRVGVVIGDVSGKGLEAASMTAKVRDTLRVYAMDGLSPAATVGKTNDLLCRFTPVEIFVTLFYATLDTRTGALAYVAAGHPAPLVLNESGGVASLVSTGPIVGAFPGVRYEEHAATFSLGDILVLFTDGLVEARKGGKMYGRDRAADAIERCMRSGVPGLKDLLGALGGDARRFAGGTLRDDMALLAIRRAPAATASDGHRS